MEITFVNGLTSSSESACLNVRIAQLDLTKGRGRFVTMPTLATVSLKAVHQRIRNIGQIDLPDTNEVYLDVQAIRVLESCA